MRMPYAYFMLIELKVDKDMRNTAIFRQLAMVVTLSTCMCVKGRPCGGVHGTDSRLGQG